MVSPRHHRTPLWKKFLTSILNFKEANRSELDAFWSALDQLAERVEWVGGLDPDSNFRARLDQTMEDYDRASSERWGSAYRKPFAILVALGTVAAEFRLTAPVSNVLGGMGWTAAGVLWAGGPTHLPPNTRTMSYASKVQRIESREPSGKC